MSDLNLHGRRRESIADIEDVLRDIFHLHPDSHVNSAGEPVVPANTLVDVFRSFSEKYDGVELMTDDEEGQLSSIVETNPGLEVTPQVLLAFIATRTKESSSPDEGLTDDALSRGRDWERSDRNGHSRSSSNESSGTVAHRSRPPSRGPPVPPKTPTSATGNPESPFDGSRRQRSTPLTSAPSSWAKRPPPAHRRRSDAGSSGRPLSDSESLSSGGSFSRSGIRTRAPSNPTSPVYKSHSPPRNPSRPHSRAQSQPQFNPYDFRRDDPSSPPSSPPSGDSTFQFSSPETTLIESVSSLPMPRSEDSDSDDDEESGLVMDLVDRSAASSTVSLAPQDRVDALQRLNADLARKLMEAERTLQNKLSEHESDLEDMQGRLEEAKSELSSTKREEKELRAKERQNTTQISALESEIQKLQKSLDNARISYQSLQKQYQEQCVESERYRNSLRRRDDEIKEAQDSTSLQTIETQKWQRQAIDFEERISIMEDDLNIAQLAQRQLEEQKQENMMLKETIDRMRFDMDELRNSAANNAQGGGSGNVSVRGSVSKSLGAELLSQMKDGKWQDTRWGNGDGEEDDGVDEDEETTVEVELDNDGEDTEGEDVIQTIITRKTRKIASRANKFPQTIRIEETKEYSDAYMQHDPLDLELVSSEAVQTNPEPEVATSISGTQTENVMLESLATQTEPEPVPILKVTVEMDVQTETPAQEDDTSTSSSSTAAPPTPKASTEGRDLPPAYAQAAEYDLDGLPLSQLADPQARRDLAIRADILRKWHKGAKLPFEPINGGVSEDAIEEWNALKDELGLECMVIDNIIATSQRTGQPRVIKDGKPSRIRRNRFYNIYNTYVYGNGEAGSGSGSSFPSSAATQVLLGIGASAIFFFALSPYTTPQYAIPGAPTYYDRAAWSSFNSMQASGEGFSPDGTAAVWNFLGRVGGGAARIARGWPT